MVKATWPSRIDRSLMNPRLTMSRCRSGSRTTFSAVRTEPWSTCMASRISYTCPPMTDVEASPNRAVMIVLAYLWLLALVPLLLEKRDPALQLHAKHGLVLVVAALLGLFAYVVFPSVVSLPALGLGSVLSIVLVFGWMGILALHVV